MLTKLNKRIPYALPFAKLVQKAEKGFREIEKGEYPEAMKNIKEKGHAPYYLLGFVENQNVITKEIKSFKVKKDGSYIAITVKGERYVWDDISRLVPED